MDSLEACESANLVPQIFSPLPLEDLFVAGYCAVCQSETRFRLGREIYLERFGYLFREALSCDHCYFNSRMRAALQFFQELSLPPDSAVYMTEQVTPMYAWIKARYPNAVGSEYLSDAQLGETRDGVRCEDIQKLTFRDSVFDAIVTLDVLEHVPDFRAALRELRRVLKSGGSLVLTAPFRMSQQATHNMARLSEHGEIEHLIDTPQYHGNPLGPPVLCFNTFGWDLLDEMRAAGFAEAAVIPYRNPDLGYIGGPFPLITGVA